MLKLGERERERERNTKRNVLCCKKPKKFGMLIIYLSQN